MTRSGQRVRRPIPRVRGGDLMQWQSDVGPVPQHIGALLDLDGTISAEELAGQLQQRLAPLAALHRRPALTPPGAGPPVWLAVDPPPVTVAPVAEHAGPAALVREAAAAMLDPFPPGGALWRCQVLDRGGRAVGVVLVLHHALADGGTGMRILAALADPGAGAGDEGPTDHASVPPQTLPGYLVLVADAWRARRRLLASTWRARGAMGAALSELGTGRGAAAPRTALSTPTGPRRRYAETVADEARLRAAARGDGGSLNDAVLVAIADLLADAAAAHGDRPDPVVISVPVATRAGALAPHQPLDRGHGNAVGVMAVPVPTSGPVQARIAAVADWRHRSLRAGDAGASLPIVLVAFRLLHALGLVRWFTDHQRLVTTFVTSVRGPDHPIRVAGAEVTGLTPLVVNQGNQTVAFATSTYALQLRITVVTDPDTGPDADAIAAAIHGRLADIAARNDTGTGA